MLETAPRVASPPHRGAARATGTVVIDGTPHELELVRQERHLGGTQAYWCCPRCSALRAHLYVLSGTLLCRVCHRLDYKSRHTLHPAVIRVAKLRQRLGGAPSLLAPLPRHWRPDYYARLTAELVAAEASIAARLHATVGQVRRRSKRDRQRDRGT